MCFSSSDSKHRCLCPYGRWNCLWADEGNKRKKKIHLRIDIKTFACKRKKKVTLLGQKSYPENVLKPRNFSSSTTCKRKTFLHVLSSSLNTIIIFLCQVLEKPGDMACRTLCTGATGSTDRLLCISDLRTPPLLLLSFASLLRPCFFKTLFFILQLLWPPQIPLMSWGLAIVSSTWRTCMFFQRPEIRSRWTESKISRTTEHLYSASTFLHVKPKLFRWCSQNTEILLC